MPMTLSRKINPERLGALIAKSRLSQKELAAKIGADVGTLSRWKRGKIGVIRSGKLAKLCEALGTTPSELCAEGPLPEAVAAGDTARRGQVTMMLDTSCRNALALVARRYGVTRQQIVEIAPLLFAITAEQALAERGEWLDAYRDAPPPHLRDLRGPSVEDDEALLEVEARSIKQRDLFAMQVGGWDEHHHKNNPFARFLSERLSKTGLKSGTRVIWDEGEAPRYWIGIDELIDLLGRDKDVLKLVLSGRVALAEMPADTRKAAPEIRALWVKEKADLNDHELRVVLEAAEDDETVLPDIADLAQILAAREDAKYDF